jgi:hypothetical protein
MFDPTPRSLTLLKTFFFLKKKKEKKKKERKKEGKLLYV